MLQGRLVGSGGLVYRRRLRMEPLDFSYSSCFHSMRLVAHLQERPERRLRFEFRQSGLMRSDVRRNFIAVISGLRAGMTARDQVMEYCCSLADLFGSALPHDTSDTSSFGNVRL